jgi:hypothetical protein
LSAIGDQQATRMTENKYKDTEKNPADVPDYPPPPPPPPPPKDKMAAAAEAPRGRSAISGLTAGEGFRTFIDDSERPFTFISGRAGRDVITGENVVEPPSLN